MVKWGDVPTWIQAGATVALFVAAVLAGIFTYRIYKIESARDERHEDERRKDQASQVSAWIEYRDYTTLPREGPTGPGYFVALNNASGLPVYDTTLHYFTQEGRGLVEDSHLIGVLPPGERTERIAKQADKELGRLQLHSSSLRVQINFVDSHGQRWQRPPDGGLESITVTVRRKPDNELSAGKLPRAWRRLRLSRRKRRT